MKFSDFWHDNTGHLFIYSFIHSNGVQSFLNHAPTFLDFLKHELSASPSFGEN